MQRSRSRPAPPAYRCRGWCARSMAACWPTSGRRPSGYTNGSTCWSAIHGSIRSPSDGLSQRLHRVGYIGSNAVDPWYTDRVGPERWDDLIGRLDARGRTVRR